MLQTHEFGRTGHHSSRVIFGAAALGRISQDQADGILPLLVANGVNHLDVAASYGDAELRLAPWLSLHRDTFFVATKTGDRDGDGARASLERSLERLGVDQIDLIQLHNLVEQDEFETAFGPGGAVEALARAREEGLVRFIGVTGHGTRIPNMHRRSLDRFDFDSVLMPYNYLMLENVAYRKDVEDLLAVCAERHVAVQTIKSIARRRWVVQPERDQRRSWYEALEDEGAIRRAVHFVLANDALFLNSSSDYRQLPAILRAASSPVVQPDADALREDSVVFDMSALFDGGDLERI